MIVAQAGESIQAVEARRLPFTSDSVGATRDM